MPAITTTSPGTNTALTTPLKPSELLPAILACFRAKRPVMLHGVPGIGKTEIIRYAADITFAEAYGCKVHRNHTVTDVDGTKISNRPWLNMNDVSQKDQVDFIGVPHIEPATYTKTGKLIKEARTVWATPDDFPSDPRGGVDFFDEINRGTVQTMNAAFSRIRERRAGRKYMPDTWVTAAAVNDKDIGVNKMSAALTRRFLHLDVTSDPDDLYTLALDRDWEPVVIAYIKMTPQEINVFNPLERVGPNSRAWENVSDTIKSNAGLNHRILQALIAGEVGDAVAVRFMAFYRMYAELPSIDNIMLNPHKADVPTDAGVQFAISAALARRAKVDNLDRIITYLDRLPVEFNIFAIKDALSRNEGLARTKAFTQWGIRHQDVTL